MVPQNQDLERQRQDEPMQIDSSKPTEIKRTTFGSLGPLKT